MAAFQPYQGGSNPTFGRDMGPPPPVPGRGAFSYGGPPTFAPPPFAFVPGGPSLFPPPFMPTQPYQYTQPPSGVPQYVAGYGGGQRYPQPAPADSTASGMPAANMTNSTGGVGCEPGYNYFFAPEHTKIHVLKSGATPPWQMPKNFTIPFHAAHVPCNVTIGELMVGFGANNPVPKKNKIYEVVQGGNGSWYKGLCFSGDDRTAMKKTLKDLGWDASRNGLPTGKPVVYLYVTKD